MSYDQQQKRIVDMTHEEIFAARRAVGLPLLPYPMTLVRKTEEGLVEKAAGYVQSDVHALAFYSHLSLEQVNGMLFRDMPVYSMMPVLADLAAKMRPESRNRLTAVWGKAGLGKSHLFDTVGRIVHPDGALVIDCGGMNLRELFFRTVIDYGHGVREQFSKALAAGKVPAPAIAALNQAFPGAVVNHTVDWDAIGRAREGESGEAAIRRAREILTDVYTQAGLSAQANAFGLKMVLGEVPLSFMNGRPLALDEFNKADEGFDSWHRFLQFAKGEIPEVTIYNPMAVSGDDGCPQSFTLRAEDMKPGWALWISGNDTQDGDTTHSLSESMESRLSPFVLDDLTQKDWELRLSQIYTGLPLTALCDMLSSYAHDKEAFAGWLLDLRGCGLPAAALGDIPAHQRALLLDFQRADRAIRKLAQYYHGRSQLARAAFSSVNTDDAVAEAAQDIAGHPQGKLVYVSPRRAIEDLEKALGSLPEVSGGNVPSFSFNLGEAFGRAASGMRAAASAPWRNLGSALSRIIFEDIEKCSSQMPHVSAYLAGLAEQCGIEPPAFHEARRSPESETVGELLRYDDLEKFGGEVYLQGVRQALIAHFSAVAGDADKQRIGKMLPLEKLGMALQDMRGKNAAFVLPNGDPATVDAMPLLAAETVDSWAQRKQRGKVLADFRAVLTAMAMPDFANDNIDNLWPREVMNFVPQDALASMNDDDKAAYDIISGGDKTGFSLCLIEAADEGGKPVYFHFLRDTQSGQKIVFGDRQPGSEIMSQLGKAGISFCLRADSQQLVEGFIEQALKARTTSSGRPQTSKDAIEMMTRLVLAESVIEDMDDVKDGENLGRMLAGFKGKPHIYKSVMVKPV